MDKFGDTLPTGEVLVGVACGPLYDVAIYTSVRSLREYGRKQAEKAASPGEHHVPYAVTK